MAQQLSKKTAKAISQKINTLFVCESMVDDFRLEKNHEKCRYYMTRYNETCDELMSQFGIEVVKYKNAAL